MSQTSGVWPPRAHSQTKGYEHPAYTLPSGMAKFTFILGVVSIDTHGSMVVCVRHFRPVVGLLCAGAGIEWR